MKDKLYFSGKNDGICHTLDYFKELLDFNNLIEIKLFEAEKEKIVGFFWCDEYNSVGDKSEGGCGKCCDKYQPKNNKSGCCKHYSTNFYKPSNKILILKG